MNKKLILAALAATILTVPAAFAAPHDHMGEGKKEEMSCPHHEAIQSSVDKAVALLDQVAKADPAKKDALAAQARQELKNAKDQMEQCRQMCSGKMEGHMDGHDHAAMGGQEGHGGHDHAAAGNAPAAQEIDPVCGMKVDRDDTLKSVYAGKAYYFCSKEDKVAFDKDPEAYLKKS
jgi:YHS domain-containing protein